MTCETPQTYSAVQFDVYYLFMMLKPGVTHFCCSDAARLPRGFEHFEVAYSTLCC